MGKNEERLDVRLRLDEGKGASGPDADTILATIGMPLTEVLQQQGAVHEITQSARLAEEGFVKGTVSARVRFVPYVRGRLELTVVKATKLVIRTPMSSEIGVLESEESSGAMEDLEPKLL